MGHSTLFRVVQLPKIFEMRGTVDDIPGRRRPALLRPVVHDCQSRRDPMHQCRASTLLPSVMGHHVNIHFAKLVHRAHQLWFFVPRQITQIQQPQFSKSDQQSHRARILGLIPRPLLRLFAAGILRARPGQRRIQYHSVRAHHRSLQPAHRQGIAYLCRNVFVFSGRQHFPISLRNAIGWRVANFPLFPVIDEGSHRYSIYQLGHAAHVILVKMSDLHVIDPAQPSLFRRRHNPVCVPPVLAVPSGIDQQRLTTRSDEQRRLSAFYVHKINSQGPLFIRPGRGWKWIYAAHSQNHHAH